MTDRLHLSYDRESVAERLAKRKSAIATLRRAIFAAEICVYTSMVLAACLVTMTFGAF